MAKNFFSWIIVVHLLIFASNAAGWEVRRRAIRTNLVTNSTLTSFQNSSTVPTATSLPILNTLDDNCAPEQIGPGENLTYVTILGARFAVGHRADPFAATPSNSSCCSNYKLELPSGWTVAPNTDTSHLAAKMFSFGADALVFSDGTAYATIESARPNRSEGWNVIAWAALGTDDQNRYFVDYSNVPQKKWGMDYNWCLQILLTQPAGENDVDNVITATERTVENFMTYHGWDYATLDDVEPLLAWGTPGISNRQQTAAAVPVNWTFAENNEIINLQGAQFGCGCLLGSNGSAFYNADKSSCGNETLAFHVLEDGTTVYWPDPRAGSLRILIVRPTSPFNLTTINMKALILSPRTADQEVDENNPDQSLAYAKSMMSIAHAEYDNIGVAINGQQYDKELPLYTVTPSGYIPHYYMIVLTSESLSYQRDDGVWESGLRTEEWGRLHRYCAQFNVRLISIFTYPSAQYGVTETPESSTSAGYLWYGNITRWEMEEGMVWQYPSTINDTIENITPYLYFTATDDYPDHDAKVAGVILQGHDGTRGNEMHLFFASSSSVKHGKPLAERLMGWAMELVHMPEKNGLSGGAIAGIVVGSVCAAALIAGVVFYYRYQLCYCNAKEKDREVHDMAEWEYQQSGY